MKILYIIESLMSGGKERRLISLIKKMLKYEIVEIEFMILSKEIHYKEIFDFNINIHYLKRNIKKDARILFKFNKILNKFEPDIVHCWDNIAAFHFAPICYFKNIPFVNSMISTAPPPNLVRFFSKRYLYTAVSYPFSKVILANSKAGLISYRVPEKKGKFIYNGLDFNRMKIKISENEIRNKFSIKTKYVIGMTAAFHDRKDYITFIKAGENILKKRNDITFVAIGDGPNLIKMKNLVEDESLRYFKFLGRQSDVESIVNIFNIGVLTTNMQCHGEGISNSIMEYMALAKPIIATIGGGTTELVIDNEIGFLIKEKNIDQLENKIEFLLANPDLANTMGEKGKKRIEKYFSIDKMVNDTYQLYKELLR